MNQKEDWLLENRQWYILSCIGKQALLVKKDTQIESVPISLALTERLIREPFYLNEEEVSSNSQQLVIPNLWANVEAS